MTVSLNAKYSFVTIKSIVQEAVANVKCDAPHVAADFWRRELIKHPAYDDEKEMLFVLCLNTKLHIKQVSLVSLGSMNESTAHPREIFRAAIAGGSYAIVLMHNHPSGDPSPSVADRNLTQKLRGAGELLNIPFFDHVIVGNETHFSFKESGLL